jgi:hypothetical protein
MAVDLSHDSVEFTASTILLEELGSLIVEHSEEEDALNDTEGHRQGEQESPVICLQERVVEGIIFFARKGDPEQIGYHDTQSNEDLC